MTPVVHIESLVKIQYLMRNRFIIKSDSIALSPIDNTFQAYHFDFSWKLLIEKVKVIGQWTKMVGDDDTDFAILINQEVEVYPININYLQNYARARDFFENHFDINFRDSYYKGTVTFPKALKGVNVFNDTYWTKIKRGFEFMHPAVGQVSPEVLQYLANNTHHNPLP